MPISTALLAGSRIVVGILEDLCWNGGVGHADSSCVVSGRSGIGRVNSRTTGLWSDVGWIGSDVYSFTSGANADKLLGRFRYRIRSVHAGHRLRDHSHSCGSSDAACGVADDSARVFAAAMASLEYLYVGGKVMADSVIWCNVRPALRSRTN